MKKKMTVIEKDCALRSMTFMSMSIPSIKDLVYFNIVL